MKKLLFCNFDALPVFHHTISLFLCEINPYDILLHMIFVYEIPLSFRNAYVDRVIKIRICVA